MEILVCWRMYSVGWWTHAWCGWGMIKPQEMTKQHLEGVLHIPGLIPLTGILCLPGFRSRRDLNLISISWTSELRWPFDATDTLKEITGPNPQSRYALVPLFSKMAELLESCQEKPLKQRAWINNNYGHLRSLFELRGPKVVPLIKQILIFAFALK